MAVNETVGINLVADTKSLRSQLREATQELIKLQNTAGASAKEIASAAKRAAELKDRIADAKSTIEAFNPDAKFKAFSQSIQGVAGAFAATQGALALVGIESEDVQKQLLKVQGALALSEGLNTVLDSVQGFKNLASVIRSSVISALGSLKSAAIATFTTLRGALIASGVGAFAIALSLIVANFDSVKEAILRLVPGLGNINNIFTNLVNKVTDFVGITSEATRGLEKFTKASARRKEDLKSQLDILEASGTSEKKLSDLRKEIVNTDLEVLRKKLATNGKLSEKEAEEFRGLKNELIIIDVKYNKTITEANKKKNEQIAKDNKEATDKQKEIDKKKLEDLRKSAEDSRDSYEKNIARLKSEDEKIADENATKFQKFLTDQEKEIEALNAKYDKQYEDRIRFNGDISGIEEAKNDELNRINTKYEQEELERLSINSEVTVQTNRATEQMQTEDSKKQAEARKKISEAEIEVNRKKALAIADTLAGLSNVLGRETAGGKALAIASTTISAIVAAFDAYKATVGIPVIGPVLAPINAGIALAAGYKSIQDILKVQIPGQSSGGSVPSLSAPTAGAGAPISPRFSAAPPTALDAASLNTISNVVARAYVVESDITGSQKRIRRIENAARI